MKLHKAFEQFYVDRTVLVTGGAGFIGSHLVHALVSCGARVTVLDDLSTGTYENLAAVHDRITFIEGSITDPDICVRAAQGCSQVFHLAAMVSVAKSLQEPQRCHEINVTGTLNLLEAARQAGAQRLVLSSSSAVYGTRDEACHEGMACAPESLYGISKLVGEWYCNHYARLMNLPCVSLRYFNVFGERQDPHGEYAAVRAKFVERMQAGKSITIFGDGLQTRDFVHVDRVVQANLLVGMLPAVQVAGQAFNVATGRSANLLQLFEQLKQDFIGYNEPIQFMPARVGDIRHSQADCSRYRALEQEWLG